MSILCIVACSWTATYLTADTEAQAEAEERSPKLTHETVREPPLSLRDKQVCDIPSTVWPYVPTFWSCFGFGNLVMILVAEYQFQMLRPSMRSRKFEPLYLYLYLLPKTKTNTKLGLEINKAVQCNTKIPETYQDTMRV